MAANTMEKKEFNDGGESEVSKFINQNTDVTKSGGVVGIIMLCKTIFKLRKQLLIASCLYIGFITDGYNVAWPSPVNIKLQNATETPLSYPITDTMGSWLASMIFFGVIGAFPAGFLSNAIGRKPSLIIGGMLMITAYIILIFSTNISMLYFGRFMIGFGQSFSSLVSFIYIGEMTSPEIRGTLMTLTGVFHNIGALTVYCVGPFTSYYVVNYVSMGIAIGFVVTCCFVPESHVYYIITGKDEAAISTLKYLKRNNDIDFEMKKMIYNVQQQKSKQVFWHLLFKKSNRKALFITTLMYFFQMNSGIIFFMFFATSIFKKAGSSIEPYVATIVIGVIALLGSLLAPIFIDRFGRRLLLIISTSGCCVCMTVMGVYFYLDKFNHSVISDLGWLPLCTMISVFIFYGVGLNNIPHTLNGEMYSVKVRGLGSSISFILAWMSGLVSTTVSSYLMIYLGSHFTFWLFGAVNATALVFVVLAIPETTGKTLTEIDDMMTN